MVNISRWPVGKIMRLPDWCFGTRWPVSLQVQSSVAFSVFDIAGLSCGNMFVIWDLWIYVGAVATKEEFIRLTLGQSLPATAAENNVNEDLLPEFGFFNGARRVIRVQSPCYLRFPQLRKPIALNGRRVIMEVLADAVGYVKVWCGLIVSELPKEVPAWVISGQDKSQI